MLSKSVGSKKFANKTEVAEQISSSKKSAICTKNNPKLSSFKKFVRICNFELLQKFIS